MDCVSESYVEEILISVLERRFQEIKSLTEHQKEALHAVINRQGRVRYIANRTWKINYFSVAPRCLQISISVRLFIYRAIILVLCPLKSLVDSRIRELRNRGISAASLSSEDVDENNLLKGAYSESFLPSEKWRNMLRKWCLSRQNLCDRCGWISCCFKMVSSINPTFSSLSFFLAKKLILDRPLIFKVILHILQ